MLKEILTRNRSLILYGIGLFLLLFGLKWLQWKFLIIDHSVEIYAGLIAIFFTGLGIWVARQLVRPETVVIEKETPPASFEPDKQELTKLSLSNREWEVLQLISRGMSNHEIADQLCLSLSTIKTHASNVFVKMDVKSRTQAIDKARRLRLTP